MTQAELLRDVEATIIGNLQIFPELFQTLYVGPEHFSNVFKPMIQAMLNSMEKHETLMTEEIFKSPGVDANLYLECGNLGFHRDKQYFITLQKYLVEKYKKRSLIELSKDLSNENIDLEEYMCMYDKIIKQDINTGSKLTVEKIVDACKNKSKFICFNRFQRFGAISRISENDLVILAAGTGTGKTAAALNLLSDLGTNYEVAYFNLEMPETRLIQRMVAMNSNVEMNLVKKFEELNQSQEAKVSDAINRLASKNITLINGSQSIRSIKSYVASHESKKHMIVFVDHIGLISCKSTNTYERMSEIARELRLISMDYNCTLIGLCQLNRGGNKEKDKEKKPSLNMLRDSGEIEQSARKVIFVWESEGCYSFVIEKNDDGPKGKVDIVFDKEKQQMYESANQKYA